MDNIVLRKLDFLTGDNFPVYEKKIPCRMVYLRDKVEGPISDSTFTPWKKLQSMCNVIHVFFSDIYRSPAASAAAYAAKIGVARPGDSGHNYGVSIDFDVDNMLKANSMDYRTFCIVLIGFGWTPYQGVNPPGGFARGKEDWHFNFIGDFVGSGSSQIMNWIAKNNTFTSDIVSLQKMLAKLKLYHGDADGVAGPLMNEAIIKFKNSWYTKKLLSFGINKMIDDQFIRMLNIVSCDVVDTAGQLII